MLPFRVKNPPESLPIATYSLIALNTIIFFATQQEMEIPKATAEAHGVSILNLSPITILTSMFLHGDVMHLIGNMLFLWIFGSAVEGRLRTPKFLLLYTIAGFAGALAHLGLLSTKITTMPLIGASGAIMGVVGAAMFMFPYAPVCFIFITFYRLTQGEFTIELPMWGAALYYLAWDVLGAMLNFAGKGGTAHLAHLGGAISAIILCFIMRPKRDDAYVADAKKTLAEDGDYTLLWKRQLEDLAKTQPDNHKVAVALVIRSYEESKMVKPEHLAHFRKHFRAILADPNLLDALAKASIQVIGNDPTALPPGDYVRLGHELVKKSQVHPARTLFEGVRKMSNVPDSEMETATYQLAQIYDQWLNQPESAYNLYYEYYQKYPMSPFIPALTERMRQMYPAVEAAAAARRLT